MTTRIETHRVCRVCRVEQPIEKYEKVPNNAHHPGWGYSRRRTCNKCRYQQYKEYYKKRDRRKKKP